MSDDLSRPKPTVEDHFHGSVTVGERGQIVIPSEVRRRYGIEPGDKLLVLTHPSGKGISLCKIDEIRAFMSTFLKAIDAAESEQSDEKPNEGD